MGQRRKAQEGVGVDESYSMVTFMGKAAIITQGCPLVDQLNIITALEHIVLAFLASIQQRRALECTFVALNGTSTHCHAYQKSTGSLQSRDTSLLRRLGVRIIEAPLLLVSSVWT